MCGVEVALYTKMEFNFYPERHEKPFKKKTKKNCFIWGHQ